MSVGSHARTVDNQYIIIALNCIFNFFCCLCGPKIYDVSECDDIIVGSCIIYSICLPGILLLACSGEHLFSGYIIASQIQRRTFFWRIYCFSNTAANICSADTLLLTCSGEQLFGGYIASDMQRRTFIQRIYCFSHAAANICMADNCFPHAAAKRK